MSKRYNAAKERGQGRMTHDDIERVMSFGPNKDPQALSSAVLDVVNMLERTKWGKQYRMPRGLARIVGIQTSNTTDHSELKEVTELAAVHDTLSGVVRYVGTSSLSPAEIATDLREQLDVKPEDPATTVLAPGLEVPVLQAA